jgi:hypothetical protein
MAQEVIQKAYLMTEEYLCTLKKCNAQLSFVCTGLKRETPPKWAKYINDWAGSVVWIASGGVEYLLNDSPNVDMALT